MHCMGMRFNRLSLAFRPSPSPALARLQVVQRETRAEFQLYDIRYGTTNCQIAQILCGWREGGSQLQLFGDFEWWLGLIGGFVYRF